MSGSSAALTATSSFLALRVSSHSLSFVSTFSSFSFSATTAPPLANSRMAASFSMASLSMLRQLSCKSGTFSSSIEFFFSFFFLSFLLGLFDSTFSVLLLASTASSLNFLLPFAFLAGFTASLAFFFFLAFLSGVPDSSAVFIPISSPGLPLSTASASLSRSPFELIPLSLTSTLPTSSSAFFFFFLAFFFGVPDSSAVFIPISSPGLPLSTASASLSRSPFELISLSLTSTLPTSSSAFFFFFLAFFSGAPDSSGVFIPISSPGLPLSLTSTLPTSSSAFFFFFLAFFSGVPDSSGILATISSSGLPLFTVSASLSRWLFALISLSLTSTQPTSSLAFFFFFAFLPALSIPSLDFFFFLSSLS